MQLRENAGDFSERNDSKIQMFVVLKQTCVKITTLIIIDASKCHRFIDQHTRASYVRELSTWLYSE